MQLVLKLRVCPQQSNKTHVCAGLYCYCGGRGFVFSPVVGVGDLGALELPTGQSTLKFFRVPTELHYSAMRRACTTLSRPAGRPNHLYWALGQQVIWAAAAEGLSPPENSLCSPSFGIRQNSGDKQANFTPF